MDAITAAVLAVLPHLATETLSNVVRDAYEGLKGVIRRKFGETAPLPRAISDLETDPQSKARVAVLSEKVADSKATEDSDIKAALITLTEHLSSAGLSSDTSGGVHVNVSRGGVFQGVAAQTAHLGTLNIGTSQKK